MARLCFRYIWNFVLYVSGPDRVVNANPACNLAVSSRALGVVAIASSLCLFLLSLSQSLGRRSIDGAHSLFWLSFCGVFIGPVLRGVAVRTSRTERILMILIASMLTYLVKLIYAPTSFAHFDEYLHWSSLSSMLDTGRVFNQNTLLPISTFYPGLELSAAALKLFSGGDDFIAPAILIGIARLVTALLIFRLVERLTASSRTAGIAAFVFMGNPSFVLFDQQFAYESLAFPLFCGCLFLSCGINRPHSSCIETSMITIALLILILGLTVTHHLTSYICACYLIAFLLCDYIMGRREQWLSALFIGFSVIACPILWSRLSGAPTQSYLGASLLLASADIFNLLSGEVRLRGFFASTVGPPTPFALKLGGIVGTALVAIGLATGYFRAIQRGIGSALSLNPIILVKRLSSKRVISSALVVLAGSALLFPVTVALRLTPYGWEIGNRLGPFVFVGVAIVLGVAVRYFWQINPSAFVTVGLASAVVTIIFSGMVAGWGVDALRGPYQVSADALSIERMGITASKWTATRLGTGNRFGSDRVNQILLAGYGKQISLTSLSDSIEISRLFINDGWSAEAAHMVSKAQLDFILVDLRLTGGRPKFGYFDNATIDPRQKLQARSLLKFNGINGVSRIYDNGYIIIYDMRSLNGLTR